MRKATCILAFVNAAKSIYPQLAAGVFDLRMDKTEV